MPRLHWRNNHFLERIETMATWPPGTKCEDDPVRPNITERERFLYGREVYALWTYAICCVAYCDDVPKTEKELATMAGLDIAVFYTVWSYKKGSGSEILNLLIPYFQDKKPWVKRFVTLSPKTEMAHNFHLKNGAEELRRNKLTVNYEYKPQPYHDKTKI